MARQGVLAMHSMPEGQTFASPNGQGVALNDNKERTGKRMWARANVLATYTCTDAQTAVVYLAQFWTTQLQSWPQYRNAGSSPLTGGKDTATGIGVGWRPVRGGGGHEKDATSVRNRR